MNEETFRNYCDNNLTYSSSSDEVYWKCNLSIEMSKLEIAINRILNSKQDKSIKSLIYMTEEINKLYRKINFED